MSVSNLGLILCQTSRGLVSRNCRNICSTHCNLLFFENNPRGEYDKDSKNIFQRIREGWKELGNETKLFRQEMIDKFTGDPVFSQPGEVLKQWEFKSDSDLKKWVTACDSDHNEGFSSCQFVISKHNHGYFTGILSTEVPKDGRTKRAGYCSIRSVRERKSFYRESFLDWTPYTHLVMRLRGDGRTYLINIATSGYFDNLWNDVYQYMLFTRGGPYWQVAKIPFSRFIFSSKGRIQDQQGPIELNSVTSVGITAADKVNGAFELEIDYLGVEWDPSHQETSSYEMYKTPRNLLGS